MQIKRFKCGTCRPEKRIWMTRRDLRKHIGENHVRTAFTNSGWERGKGYQKQKWWIEEVWNGVA